MSLYAAYGSNLDPHRMAERAPQHEYQILTKRADRWPEIGGLALARFGRWPTWILPGVTVESALHLDRLEHLALVTLQH